MSFFRPHKWGSVLLLHPDFRRCIFPGKSSNSSGVNHVFITTSNELKCHSSLLCMYHTFIPMHYIRKLLFVTHAVFSILDYL